MQPARWREGTAYHLRLNGIATFYTLLLGVRGCEA